MPKAESPRGNAGSKTATLTSHLNSVEQAVTTSVWEIVERDRRVRLADLRARVRDWSTRGDLVRALVALLAAGALVISGSVDGPVVEVKTRGGAR